MSEVSRLRSGR